MTGYPKDVHEDLLDAFRTQPKVRLHSLAVQSGSDRILRLMNEATRATYLEVAALRAARPGLSLTSDLIVGFPETEEEFLETISLMEEVRYDSVFSRVFGAPGARRKLRRLGPGSGAGGVWSACRRPGPSRALASASGAPVLVLGPCRDPEVLRGRTPSTHGQLCG